MIELRSEYIEIQIEYTILTWDIVHILVDLVLVLDADDITDESRLYRRDDVVADVAGQIGEFPSILLICYCFL
jgi:hypothetical protein